MLICSDSSILPEITNSMITHSEPLSSVSSDLIQATQESNVNIPQMADTLFERAGNASWIVVFKALVSTHHLMVHGNEVRLPALSQSQNHIIEAFIFIIIVSRMLWNVH